MFFFFFLSDFGRRRRLDPLGVQEVSQRLQEGPGHRRGECHWSAQVDPKSLDSAEVKKETLMYTWHLFVCLRLDVDVQRMMVAVTDASNVTVG